MKPVTIQQPADAADGKTAEWRNATIPAYQRRTKQADALIAGAYLAVTNAGVRADRGPHEI